MTGKPTANIVEAVGRVRPEVYGRLGTQWTGSGTTERHGPPRATLPRSALGRAVQLNLFPPTPVLRLS